MANFKVKRAKVKTQKPFEVKRSVEDEARDMIGDGKTPNKYFVTISDDYVLRNPKTHDPISASELWKIDSKGKTIKSFDNYEEARQFADSFSVGKESYDGIKVNSVFVEDRLSGQVYNKDFMDEPDGREEIKYTILFEEKKGVPSTLYAKEMKGDFVSQIMAYENGEMTPSQEDSFLKKNADKLRNMQGHYGRELERRGY